MCNKVFDCEKCLDYPYCQTIKDEKTLDAKMQDANKIKLELISIVKK